MTELLNTTHKDELVRLIKSHIIDGNLDSETLVQRIKEGRGSYEIIAMSGATYIASRDGEIIILTDVQGVSGQIEKSDINASNGVVHVLDTVLGLN